MSDQDPDWMDTPEKRRSIWAWLALASAYGDDESKTEEHMQRAIAEDEKCKEPLLKKGATE